MIDEEPSLLILSGVQRDPRRYRTFHLYEQARLAGLKCQLSHVTDPGLRKKVDASLVVILHRAPFDGQVAWLEREIHRKGGILIQDLDDLVFDPDAVKYIRSIDFSDPIRLSLYQEEIRLHRKTLDICDFVLTSSEFLADRVRQLGKPVRVHRNGFSLEMQACSEQAYHSQKIETGKIVVGYASGTPTHDQDFALIKPAIQSLLKHYPNVELWIVGRLDPGKDWDGLESHIKKLNFVPWRNLPEIQTQFDINLAPLRIDNPFGQSKSEIKYMEAALVRVPTIASPSESFKDAILHGDNGFLANDIQDWERCLEVLVKQPQVSSSMGENAYQDVLQHYHPLVRAHQLVDSLNSFNSYRFEFHYNDQKMNLPDERLLQSYWSSAKLERSPNLFQRGLYTLRYRNLQTLLKQIWIFIRRMVSPLFPYRNPS
jgi:glycosyltransferase involved in cell wall biosynthesis